MVRKALLLALICGSTSTLATQVHAEEVLDQVSPASNAWFYCFEPTNVWQQQVRVQVGGRLTRLEVATQGPETAQVHLRIRAGDGWNAGAVLWSEFLTKTQEGYELVQLDIAGDLLFGAGETFVLEAQGNDTGAEIVGNYMNPASGAPQYPEPLFLNGPGCYEDCGWRIGFRTWMETDLSESFCVSLPNSTGAAAQLDTQGSFRVTDNSLQLVATGLPAGQPTLFFYGPEPTAQLFGGGVLCVGTGGLGLARVGVVGSDLAGQSVLPLDLTAPVAPALEIQAGSTWYFQAWYRDPLAGVNNLTDGQRISFLP